MYFNLLGERTDVSMPADSMVGIMLNIAVTFAVSSNIVLSDGISKDFFVT